MRDIEEIARILDDFSKLNTEELNEDMKFCHLEVEKIRDEIFDRLERSAILKEKVEELTPYVEDLKQTNEDLTVELIRLRTKWKKLQKHIGKVKDLNSSTVRVEATQNDRRKAAKNEALLNIIKSITSTHIDSNDEGVSINQTNLEVQNFKLKSQSKKNNLEAVWENLAKTSTHVKDFDALFNQQE